MPSLPRYRSAIILVAAAGLWGVATAISKEAVDQIPPLVLLPIQLGVSVAALVLALWATRTRVVWSPQLRRLAALGVLNPGVSYALSLAGLAHVTASMSVLLWAVEPVLIMLAARALLGERLPVAVQVGAATALAGVGLIVYRAGAAGAPIGIALTLGGVVACAAYTVACRWLIVDDAALPVVAVQQAAALAFAVLLVTTSSAVTRATPGLGAVTPAAWGAALVSGIAYYALAFWLYLTALRQVPAGIAAVFLTLIPVFGITAGRILLAEHLSPRQWLGAALVVTAVAALALHRRTGTLLTDSRRFS